MSGKDDQLMITLKIDRVPSVNNLFRNLPGGGRAKGQSYRNWIRTMGLVALSQRQVAITGPVIITIEVEDKGQGDIDNKIKPCLDLLVSLRLIDGDGRRTVRSVTARWNALIVGTIIRVVPVV